MKHLNVYRLTLLAPLLLVAGWCMSDLPAQSEPQPPTDVETEANDDATSSDAADPAATSPDDTTPEADVADAAQVATSGLVGMLSRFMTTPPIGWLVKGGLFMWPILLMGILATGVTIERFRSLKMLSSDSSEVRRQVKGLLAEDRIEDAMRLCEREQGPVPAVLFAGLRKYYLLRRLNYDPASIQQQVVKAMEDYSVHIVAALEKHLPILATISGVASMLGFLGTVQGMIVAFDEIQAGLGSANIIDLAAGGIKVSLMTTCFGLIVGIPAYVAFNYFTGVVNRFVLEVEETSADLIETVTLEMATDSPSL